MPWTLAAGRGHGKVQLKVVLSMLALAAKASFWYSL